MMAIVRISGDVDLSNKVRNTLERLKLRRKYSCTILNENDINKGMVKKIRDFIAYGHIDKETFKLLLEKRGQLIDKKKKIEVNKLIEQFEKGKKFEELNMKPFFRLHPPRKGIDSKKHFGVKKGVLGDNKDKINDLIRRML